MLSEKLNKILELNVTNLFIEVMKDHEADIIQLNQLQMSEDGTMDVENPGVQLQYAKSSVYAKQRYATYKNTDFIDLHFNGALYAEMMCVFFQKFFEIHSLDPKWPNFIEPQERFSKALGLTDKSKEITGQLVKEDFIKAIREAI